MEGARVAARSRRVADALPWMELQCNKPR